MHPQQGKVLSMTGEDGPGLTTISAPASNSREDYLSRDPSSIYPAICGPVWRWPPSLLLRRPLATHEAEVSESVKLSPPKLAPVSSKSPALPFK